MAGGWARSSGPFPCATCVAQYRRTRLNRLFCPPEFLFIGLPWWLLIFLFFLFGTSYSMGCRMAWPHAGAYSNRWEPSPTVGNL